MKRLLIPLLFMATTAIAQDYPQPENIWVNDYADLLSADQKAELTRDLQDLREETGVEMTVLTITSVSQYALHTGLEPFATGLFNNWGIGDSDRNDGILVLIARQDRKMRLELGSGYPRAWDDMAGSVIDNSFLPRFREEDYAGGILQGTAATIDRIARPFSAGTEPDKPLSVFWFTIPPVLLVLGLIFRQWLADFWMRLRRCPTCSRRGLHAKRTVTKKSTRKQQGTGQREVWCSHCDYRNISMYRVARIASTSSSSSFGGGSSSGGGASGRW